MPSPPSPSKPSPALSPAPWSKRILAFFMDWFILTLFTAALLLWFVFPRYYPETLAEFQEKVETLGPSAWQAGSMDWSEESKRAQAAATNLSAGIFWAYFFVSALLLNGASPGQTFLGLHIRTWSEAEAPSIGKLFLRSGIKAICMTNLFLAVGLIIAFFTTHHRALHDYLSGSLLVENENDG